MTLTTYVSLDAKSVTDGPAQTRFKAATTRFQYDSCSCKQLKVFMVSLLFQAKFTDYVQVASLTVSVIFHLQKMLLWYVSMKIGPGLGHIE